MAAKSKKSQKITPSTRWHKAFFAALSAGLSITSAAEKAGKAREHVTRLKKSNPTFAVAFNRALAEACDRLEDEARRRAETGLRRLKFYKGNPIMVEQDGKPVPYVEHEYSDSLLIALLKAHRPKKFREHYEVKHKGLLKVDHGSDVARAILSNPEAADLAGQLLDRLAQGNGAGGPGLAGK